MGELDKLIVETKKEHNIAKGVVKKSARLTYNKGQFIIRLPRDISSSLSLDKNKKYKISFEHDGVELKCQVKESQ